MSPTFTIATLVLAVVAAARSTWSPCGLSMLSSITPLSERGRGQRFGSTAAWYFAGAVLGGATLGGALSAGAAAVRSLGLSAAALMAVGAVAALAGAAADLGLLGFQLPVLRRQVNERWLDHYRGWVYGGGFGWQIGVGLATYVMTAGVLVVIVLAIVSATPWLAFAAGLTFGTARGCTVFANARVRDAVALRAAHRRYAAWRRPVWVVAVAAQLAVAGAVGALVWIPSLGVVAAAAVTVLAVARPARLAARAGEARV